LTVIGQFAQAIVAHEIENNRFEIRTNASNVKVSWQVAGVRQDAYAKAHPLVVEQEKDARLRGFYIHPDLFGAPPERQIEWARHPQMMKRIQETQARQLTATQKQAAPRN
jgi:trimeric autotransporter adhesin